MKIKRALISVYDKENIVDLVKFLIEQEVEIITTGNTYDVLSTANLKVKQISEYTDFPEIIDGRVKTLHPKIHGGILNNRASHSSEMAELQIGDIDLVIVNLYPFWQVSANHSSSEQEILENIDIGGVTLLRAAAKNFHNVIVICQIKDYDSLQQNIINHDISIHYRKSLATQAFSLTAKYDAMIYNWFNKDNQNLPEELLFHSKKVKTLSSGENHHQSAAFYSSTSNKYPFQQLCGKALSYNNLLDIDSALNIISEFTKPAAAIIKHNNPCGVAISGDIFSAYVKAFSADEKSSFGGIVVLNRNLDIKLAEEIKKIFFEIIIVPSINDDAFKILQSKKNIRIMLYNNSTLFQNNKYDIKNIRGGFVLQEPNKSIISKEQLQQVTDQSITKEQECDLLFAWKVCKYVKSNAIVIAHQGATLGIGAGQMSRVDSLKIALLKARYSSNAVLASDGFFPFPDSIILSAEAKIAAIIQPGGSIRDKEVIEEANRNNIAMVFTATRNFYH